MAIGFSYQAPYYLAIQFDASNIKGVRVDQIVPLPKDFEVINSFEYNDLLSGKYLSFAKAVKIADQSPEGLEKVFVISL